MRALRRDKIVNDGCELIEVQGLTRVQVSIGDFSTALLQLWRQQERGHLCHRRFLGWAAARQKETNRQPASKNYIFDRPARAGSGGQCRIAHIENESRLPSGIAEDFAKQASAQCRLSERLLMVDHFHCLIARPSCQATSRGQQVGPLPDSSCE